MYLLHEMHKYIGREEGEEEPERLVAPETARAPKVRPLHRFDRMMIAVYLKREVESIDGKSDGAPADIRDEQSFRLVLDVFTRIARDGLVEVACLEEKEAHEEERPRHDRLPPSVCIVSAEGDGVQRDHSDDADAAEEVEGMVALFHWRKAWLSFKSQN